MCRQESSAAAYAGAYGKLTGEPGICFVTRGPGATNASIGVHTAFQDSTPMILFVGQVGNDFMEREAFQEIDYRRMFRPHGQVGRQIDRCDRIPEFIARAYATATSGRPGSGGAGAAEHAVGHGRVPDMPRYSACRTIPARRTSNACARALDAARHPFLLLGGGGWTARAVQRIATASPSPSSCRSAGLAAAGIFDQRHPNAPAGSAGA